MVTTETKILYALFGAAVMFFLLKSCSKPVTNYVEKSSDTIIYRDNLIYQDTGSTRLLTYVRGEKLNLSFDDSVDIWYAMEYPYYVSDSVTLQDSTGATIFRGLIEDTIAKNKLSWRRFTGQIVRPYMKIENTFEPIVDYRYLSFGLEAQTTGQRTEFLIDGLYQNKKGNGILVGYGPSLGIQEKVIKIGYLHRFARFK